MEAWLYEEPCASHMSIAGVPFASAVLTGDEIVCKGYVGFGVENGCDVVCLPDLPDNKNVISKKPKILLPAGIALPQIECYYNIVIRDFTVECLDDCCV